MWNSVYTFGLEKFSISILQPILKMKIIINQHDGIRGFVTKFASYYKTHKYYVLSINVFTYLPFIGIVPTELKIYEGYKKPFLRNLYIIALVFLPTIVIVSMLLNLLMFGGLLIYPLFWYCKSDNKEVVFGFSIWVVIFIFLILKFLFW